MTLAELSEIYTRLATQCLDALPTGWKTFWLKAECDSTASWGETAYYELADVEEIQPFDLPEDASDCIPEVWQASRSMGDDWTVFEMTISYPGEMRVVNRRVDLKDLTEDVIDRSEAFRQRSFGDRKTRRKYPEGDTGGFRLTPDMLNDGTFDALVRERDTT